MTRISWVVMGALLISACCTLPAPAPDSFDSKPFALNNSNPKWMPLASLGWDGKQPLDLIGNAYAAMGEGDGRLMSPRHVEGDLPAFRKFQYAGSLLDIALAESGVDCLRERLHPLA